MNETAISQDIWNDQQQQQQRKTVMKNYFRSLVIR